MVVLLSMSGATAQGRKDLRECACSILVIMRHSSVIHQFVILRHVGLRFEMARYVNEHVDNSKTAYVVGAYSAPSPPLDAK